MAYFDSEKNKAIWSKRLAVLEQERERRKREGYRPSDRTRKRSEDIQITNVKPGVREITFEQLVAKEEARHASRKRQARAARQAAMEKSPQMQAQTESKVR